MITARLATAADIDAYYGTRLHESLRAYVIFMNGEPMALIGIARHKTYSRMFSEFKPEFREHLQCVTILRTIKKAMQFVKESRVPVIAVAQSDEPTSRSILKRLGFRYWKSTPVGEAYQWPR